MKTVFSEGTTKPEPDAATVPSLIAQAVESLGELVVDHIRLARVELATDVRIYASATGGVVVAVLLVTIGYLFASAAAALALAPLTGMPVAFALVAALHLVVGGLCVHVASTKARRTRLLRETTAEARRTAHALAHPSGRQVA